MFKDAVTEHILDGSEGAGRANGSELADAVDVGVSDEVLTSDEVPDYSEGV